MSNPLQGLLQALSDGTVVSGTFELSENDNGNLQIEIQVPVTYYDEETDTETTQVETITNEIPKSMLKMAQMMGMF